MIYIPQRDDDHPCPFIWVHLPLGLRSQRLGRTSQYRPTYLMCNLYRPFFTYFYSQDEAKRSKYPNGTDFSFPLNSQKMRNLMTYNPKLYNTSNLSQAYYRFFEVALGYWLTRGNTSYNNDDFVTYSMLLGGQVDPTSKSKTPSFQVKHFETVLPVRKSS